MKKLVTIVSAVMMLLMLAACAPTLMIDAEQAAAIKDGNTAMAILAEYIESEVTKGTDGYTLSAVEKDTIYTLSSMFDPVKAVDVTIGKGTEATISSTSSADNTTTTEISVNATVTWKEANPDKDAEEKTITKTTTVEFAYSSESTTTDGETTGSVSMGPFKVNGTAYEPALAVYQPLAALMGN